MSFFKTRQEKLNRRAVKAAAATNLGKLEALLAEGASIEATDDYGRSMLYAAVDRRNLRTAKLLIARGADVHYTRPGGRSCLMEAASDGSYEIAQLLIERGADVNARGDEGYTPLHYAAQNGRADMVKLLLANGAVAETLNSRMNTAADLADKEHPRLADFLRGKKPEDTQIKPAGWHLTAPDEVCSIAEKSAIGYRLTEIFNFGAGIYTRIAQNLQSGAESQSVRFFDEFPNRGPIDAAEKALIALGGDSAALKPEKACIPKPKAGAL